jgi:hypothetical protein
METSQQVRKNSSSASKCARAERSATSLIIDLLINYPKRENYLLRLAELNGKSLRHSIAMSWNDEKQGVELAVARAV